MAPKIPAQLFPCLTWSLATSPNFILQPWWAIYSFPVNIYSLRNNFAYGTLSLYHRDMQRHILLLLLALGCKGKKVGWVLCQDQFGGQHHYLDAIGQILSWSYFCLNSSQEPIIGWLFCQLSPHEVWEVTSQVLAKVLNLRRSLWMIHQDSKIG